MSKRALIVEDEAFVALELEDTLLDSGYEVSGPVGEVAPALDLIEVDRIDVAVLDANLNGTSSAPIADQLRCSNIPFVVVSGYTMKQLGDWINDAPLLSKPIRTAELTDTLSKLT